MTNYSAQVQKLLAGMDEQNEQQDTNTERPKDAIQDIYVLIVREHEEVEEDQSHVVESVPAPATTQVDSTHVIPQKISFIPAYAICSFYLFLIISCIAFQVYLILNPPIATVTIIPKSQQVTLNGTLQLGRLLQPITISQSQTDPTTGKGHQDARVATGTVAFYNGLFTQQFIASGTVYTGYDGVEIVTTQDATIPEGNPSSGYGTLTVTAQAVEAGSKGNIQAGDINITINNGLLVRNNQFHNGQDERNFQTVTRSDVSNVASTLKSSLDRSMSGALAAQAKPNEALTHPLCSETVSPNHQARDEAIQVQVTVSLTCSAVAYNTKELETKARVLLTTKAQSKLAGYSLFGAIQVSVNQVSVTSASHPLVFLSFQSTGTWEYGLSRQSQEHIKELIAGKTKDQALHIIASMPGVERGSISFHGFGDDTKLPKNSVYIHITLLVM